MTGLFYPQHILYVKASELAFEDCFYSKKWTEAIDYGSLCLSAYKKYTLGDQVNKLAQGPLKKWVQHSKNNTS